jgi:TrmH RNA methyltransferase
MNKPYKPKRPAPGEAGKGAHRRETSPRPTAEPRPASDDKSDRPTSWQKVDRISGLSAVNALFRCDPERVERLYYSERMKTAAGPYCSTLAAHRRPYRMVAELELERVAGTVLHGGIVAAARPRTIPVLAAADLRRWAAAREPLVILDGIGNPHNLGAIARTLAFFGLRRLVLSDHPAQAGLSDAAYRVAEGGLEYLAIHSTAGLPEWLREMRSTYRVVGTAAEQGADLRMLEPAGKPVCLVLGNEETGLSRTTLRACESVVMIRGVGQVQSLNVSATTAILVSHIVGR